MFNFHYKCSTSTTSVQLPLQVFNIHYKCSTSTTSVQQNTRFLRSRCLFKRCSATALLQVKRGYWSCKPPSRRTYKIRRRDFFPTIRSTRENKEITTDELRTRTTSHVSSTKNSFFFGSRVAGFLSDLFCLEYWLLHPFFYEETISKRSTGKGLPYAAKAVPVGRRGTNQLRLVERYLDVLVKHTTDIPPPTALVEGTALVCLSRRRIIKMIYFEL